MKYFSHFENQFWTKFDNKIQPFSMKFNENLAKNWDKIHRKSHQILYYPLLKIERKSLKVDNNFTQNQWKSSSKLSKIQIKLTIIWPQIDLKSCQIPAQKWYKNLNAVNPLRGHQVIQKFWCCKYREGS